MTSSTQIIRSVHQLVSVAQFMSLPAGIRLNIHNQFHPKLRVWLLGLTPRQFYYVNYWTEGGINWFIDYYFFSDCAVLPYQSGGWNEVTWIEASGGPHLSPHIASNLFSYHIKSGIGVPLRVSRLLEQITHV